MWSIKIPPLAVYTEQQRKRLGGGSDDIEFSKIGSTRATFLRWKFDFPQNSAEKRRERERKKNTDVGDVSRQRPIALHCTVW